MGDFGFWASASPLMLGRFVIPLVLGSGQTSITIPDGGTATLAPVFASGTGQILNGASSVVVASAVSGSTYPQTGLTGSQTYTLQVTNLAGDQATATVTVTVSAPVVSTVSPATANLTVGAGQAFSASVTGAVNTGILWSVDSILNGNAAVGTIDGSGNYVAGTIAGTHTIIATAAADGATNQTASVTVYAAPVATSLTSSSTTPLYGATFTVTPTYSNGTGVINNGVTCPATTVASAAQTANWSGARTYTLTVTNVPGQTATASVVVTPQTVSVGAVTPANSTKTVSTATVFSSTVTSGSLGTVIWSSTAGTWASNTWTAPATAQSVTITATSVDDPTKTATTSVTVVAAPVATAIVATKGTVTSGTGTTVTPTSSGGTATIGTSGTGSSDLSASATSGTGVSTGNLAATKTYTLTVTNAAGTQATASCTVTVVAAATSSISASTLTPLYGATSTTITPTFTGASSAKVGTSQGGSQISSAPTSGTSIGVQASGFTTATSYWLRATNAAGDYLDSSVTVVSQVVSVGTISPASPSESTNSTTPFSVSVTGGYLGTVTWSSTAGSWSGNSWTAPAIAQSVTITATSVDDPSKTASTTVTVTGAMAISTVTPAAPSLPMGTNGALATKTFTATVTGNANTAITWTCSGGTITSGGVWSASGCNPGTYTITATSQAVGTVHSSTTLTLTDPGFNVNEGIGGYYNVGMDSGPQPCSHNWTHQSRFYGPISTPTQQWLWAWTNNAAIGGVPTAASQPVIGSDGNLRVLCGNRSQGTFGMEVLSQAGTAVGAGFGPYGAAGWPTILADLTTIGINQSQGDEFYASFAIHSATGAVKQYTTGISDGLNYTLIGPNTIASVITTDDGCTDYSLKVETFSTNSFNATTTALSPGTSYEGSGIWAESPNTFGPFENLQNAEINGNTILNINADMFTNWPIQVNGGSLIGRHDASITRVSVDLSANTLHDTLLNANYWSSIEAPITCDNLNTDLAVSYNGMIYIVDQLQYGSQYAQCGWIITCISSVNGSVSWQKVFDPLSSSSAATSVVTSPIIGRDGTIYCAADGMLYAISSAGSVIWSYALPSPLLASDGFGNITDFYGNTNIYYSNAESIALGSDGTLYLSLQSGVVALR